MEGGSSGIIMDQQCMSGIRAALLMICVHATQYFGQQVLCALHAGLSWRCVHSQYLNFASHLFYSNTDSTCAKQKSTRRTGNELYE